MKVVGLCGGSGSGKGEVSRIFGIFGIPSIDTDEIYHRLISQKTDCLHDLVFEFGEEILDSDGFLDRKKLRDIVFAKGAERKLQRLNEISHAHILNQTRNIISNYRNQNVKAVLIDAPLLFESGFDKECDFVISVIADKDIRASRIVSRDNISNADALKRIESQLSDEYLIKNSKYHIINNGDLEELKDKIKKLLCEFI